MRARSKPFQCGCMIESHDYRLQLTGEGRWRGVFSDPEGELESLDVAPPPEFGGPAGVWSPEHLFLAAVSSCLMTTFRSIAEIARIEVLDYSDDAIGHLARGEDRLYSMDAVRLRPRVVLAAGSDVEKARKLMDKADHVCLVSRSVCADITVEPTFEMA